MQVDRDDLAGAIASEALLEACAWSRTNFFREQGPSEPNVLADGAPGRTLHSITDDGDETCRVWLPMSNPAATVGLPDIAAHEGFHVAAGANVYHWTHEAFACLTAHLSHLRQEEDDSALLTRRQLGESLLGQARLFSRFYSAREMRKEAMPVRADARMQGFYSRARVVGVDLYEATGLELLALLARSVKNVRCDSYPHHRHDGCPMDQAVRAWLDDLPMDVGERVRTVLEL